MNEQVFPEKVVLIVDDNPHDLSVLTTSLTDAGLKVSISQNGEHALQRVERLRPDIILLDVMMPGIDGFEVCRRLKANAITRDIPVIFMTAMSDTVDKVHGLAAGAVDYISKPLQTEEVLARVHTHLTMRSLHVQLQEQNARFHLLAEAALEGILVHRAGVILELNHAAAQMLGYAENDLVGRDLRTVIAPDDRAASQAMLAPPDAQAELRPAEIEMLRRDQTRIPVEIQAKQMTDQSVSVLAIRDLTWRKQMEAEQQQLRKENTTLRSGMRERYKFGVMIGKSRPMQQVYQAIAKAAAAEASVVIYGESGTGKELVARTIHEQSGRRRGPFVPVNCGAIPDTLFEREFFGHRKGAFTGANLDSPGYFGRAHTGTLFLDEVGELSPAMQVKLLRALQEKEYVPLGDTRAKKVDVRILAASNKDLVELMQQGQMREDFFYRLRVMVITVPPLRERKEDLPLLVEDFLATHAAGSERPAIPGRVLEQLSAYHWPGNIRELHNELHRYLMEQRLEFIGNQRGLPPTEDDAVADLAAGPGNFRAMVAAYEKRLISAALTATNGHIGQTLKVLKIPQKTLYRKMRAYGLADA